MISTADLQDWMKAEDVDAPVLRILEEAAIKTVQKQTGRYWGVTATQTEIIRFVSWPLPVANAPIGGVLTSLEQWNGNAWALVDASNYYVDGCFIWPNASYTWPPSYQYPYSPLRFRVIYSAGYTVDASDADVWPAPDDIKQAVRHLVGNWFENREAVVIGMITSDVKLTVDYLLAPYVRTVV